MGRRLLVRQKDGKLVYYDIQQKKTNINSAGVYKIVPDDGYLLDEVEVDANGILLDLVDEEYYVCRYNLDTGIFLTENCKIEVEFMPLQPINKSTTYLSYFSNRNVGNDTNNVVRQIYYDNNYNLFGASTQSITAISFNGITYEQGQIIKIVLVSEGNEQYGQYYVNGELKNTTTYEKLNYLPINNTFKIGGSSMTGYQNGLVLYKLKMWNDGVLVFDGIPKNDKNTGYHYLINDVDDSIIGVALYNKNDVATLELSEVSDTQTITVTNEEYEAILPTLEKMRNKE